MEGASAKDPSGKPLTQEEIEKQIVQRFQEMRDEKQKVAAKIAEMTTEVKEHE